MVEHLILWDNGMVMAFDARGQQVSEGQGPISEETLLRLCTERTKFSVGVWRGGTSFVSLEVWLRTWRRNRYYQPTATGDNSEPTSF